MLLASILIGMTVLASLSPALTYTRLWQTKEWRMDRLLEHLRGEGWWGQLMGSLRPTIVGTSLLCALPHIVQEGILAPLSGAGIALLGLCSMIVLHAVLALTGRQKMPVRTSKLLAILGSSVALTGVIATIIVWGDLHTSLHAIQGPGHLRLLGLLFLPVLQPLTLLLSWLVWSPVDRWRKGIIMEKATNLRRRFPHLRVIGITGSVGKTTTKELIAHLLRDEGAISTPLHVNTEMGVSEWLLSTLATEPPESTRILVVEMGAYRCGEIALLCDIAQPTIGVVTYVGKQHVSLFGSEEAIARGKGELLASLPHSGQAFVNGDSPLLDLLLSRSSVRPITVGTHTGVNVQALDIEEVRGGIRFQLDGTTYEAPLAGTHLVTNIILALTVARSLGVAAETLRKRLIRFAAFERTFSLREERGVTVLDNSYNSSFEGFEAAIAWAATQPHATKVLIFSGIIELGDNEERLHMLLAEKAAHVFEQAYATQKRFERYFRPSFGQRLKGAMEPHQRLLPGSLLVCMGRMPQSLIRTFLPTDSSN